MGVRRLKKNLLILLTVSFLAVLGIGLYSGLKSVFSYRAILSEIAERPQNTDAATAEAEANSILQGSSATEKTKTAESSGKAKPSRKSRWKKKKGTKNCPTECQNRILNLLGSGAKLSLSDADVIIENADLFAALLAENPEKLASLLSSLQEDEGENDHDQFAAQAVWAALTDEDRLKAGQSLLEHPIPDFRIIGVKLSDSEVTNNLAAAQAFDGLIRRETDARVLITALNAINLQDEAGPYAANILTGLDQVLALHDSDYIKGNALLAKAKVATSTADTAVDIRRALTSSSAKYRGLGLRAFSVTIERRNNLEETSEFHWTRNQDTEDLLQSLIDNPDLGLQNRQLATKLLESL